MDILNDLPPVNLLAILCAAIAMLAVGALWYSPRLFGKSWVRLTGIRKTDIRQGEARRGRIIGVLCALIASYLIGLVDAHTASNPMMLFSGIAFIWLFVMLEYVGGFTWKREAFALCVLQSFRSLFMLLAGALVFFLWS